MEMAWEDNADDKTGTHNRIANTFLYFCAMQNAYKLIPLVLAAVYVPRSWCNCNNFRRYNEAADNRRVLIRALLDRESRKFVFSFYRYKLLDDESMFKGFVCRVSS